MNDAELLAIIAQAEREGWTELDLSGNDLERLPSEIGRLQSLEKLILGKVDKGHSKGNRLTAIPQEIFHLQMELNFLPQSFFVLDHINQIYLLLVYLYYQHLLLEKSTH